MSLLRNLVFVASYLLIAVASALILPLLLPDMGRQTGVLFGLIVFVAGGLLHEVFARQEQDERTTRRLLKLRHRVDELAQAVEGLAPGAVAAGASSSSPQLDAVVSEVRMLQALVSQLPQTGTVEARARARGTAPADDQDGPATPPRAVPAAPGRATRPLTAAVPETSRAADAEVLDKIQDALRSDRVDIFLQPIVSLPQRKHRYYEVFSRIRDADGTYLTPDRYLDVAERANLIAAIDNMLLFRCIQLIRETEKRHQNVGFFCNISAATLDDAAFMTEFVPYMGQNQSLTTKLVFELSQNDLMAGGVFATGFLDGLRRLGFRFSMDQVDRLDLNFEELARQEIRYVKLDAARLLDPDGRFATPEKVAELKGQMDRNAIDLIVEKIETDAQLLELLDLFIDFGQGYLFGEPRLARRQS